MELDAPDLYNDYVSMVPLTAELYCALREAGGMEFIWQSLPAIPKGTGYTDYYKYMVRRNNDSCIYPYAVLDRLDADRFVGVAAFVKPHRTHRRVRFGYTWLNPDVRGTHLFAALKHLMIRRALNWGARRIEAFVDSQHEAAIQGMLNIGAQQEGVLRQYQKSAEGIWVDIAVLSLLRDEAKRALEQLEKQLSLEVPA